jgi:hypothetical protein
MYKKLILACMAVAAFAAFGMSATSASATTLTHPTGTAMGTCTGCLKATNVGHTVMTNAAGETLITCTTATMTGNLDTNSGGSVAGTITSASFSGTGTSGDCTTSIGGSVKVTTQVTEGVSTEVGVPYCIKNTKEDKFEVRGGACSEAARSIKYTLDFTGDGSYCGFQKSSLTGTFTTDATGDAIFTTDNEGVFTRYEQGGFQSIFCPTEAKLDMTFTLETDSGTAEPVYLS